jgi:hypothetical protein
MMRFVFVFLGLFVEVVDVFSQTEEKAILVGIHNSFIINNNSISFSLSPQIGYFIRKKMLLGLSTPPSMSSSSLIGIYVPHDGFVKNRGLVSSFVRFYLFNEAKFQFYLQQSGDFYRFKTNIPDLEKVSGKIIFGTTFNLGIAYFVDNSTTLEFCYSRPLLSGNIELFPISRIAYLKFGVNYMFKKRQFVKQ